MKLSNKTKAGMQSTLETLFNAKDGRLSRVTIVEQQKEKDKAVRNYLKLLWDRGYVAVLASTPDGDSDIT